LALIRGDLALSYAAIGLLLSVPTFAANLIEMPIGLLGDSPRRARLVIGGGVVFVVALFAIALAPAFAWLLLALCLLYPASGAFVGLSQADLMDAAPERREQNMARWTLAGSIGALAGPALLASAIFVGAGWRGAYAAIGFAAAVVLASRVLAPTPPHAHGQGIPHFRAAVVSAVRSLFRGEVARSLALLEVSDLMLDGLTAYLALYFVDVLHQPVWFGAVVVAVRVAANLAGDVVSVNVLERIDGTRYVRVTAVAAAFAYAGVLLIPGVFVKLALVALLSLLTSGWYPVLQAKLYHALPGQSGASIAIGNVFRMVATPVALIIGLLAARFGLSVALWMLIAGPVVLALAVRSTDQATA
jgi:FSR family fosmidomycin resistance protein-like MFS transporter